MENVSGEEREPKILIPFFPPGEDFRDHQDFFIILRPETNGAEVESLLMQVIRGRGEYKSGVSFVYLANISGDYIVRHRVIEQHYHLKISFARKGAGLFTPGMEEQFYGKFGVRPQKARILGAFKALEYLGMTEDELFDKRVDMAHMLDVNGQNIKKINDIYVVNYDIPALLHKNSRNTDIAVMIFRSRLPKTAFREMIGTMGKVLVEKGILREHFPLSRVFHYSKGPLEFLLDASGYLLRDSRTPYPLGSLDFVKFLNEKGISLKILDGLIRYPMVTFQTSRGGLVEGDILQYTYESTFNEAYQILLSTRSQFYIS